MTESGPVLLERRAHPRVEHHAQGELLVAGEATPIPCETVDISLGGAKITSVAPVPVGPCSIRLEGVEFPGTVLGQVIDIETGLMISRVQFAEISTVAHDELVAITTATAAPIPAPPAAAVPSRRRVVAIAAAAAVLIAVIVAALLAGGSSSDDDADAAALASDASTEPSSSDDEEPAASASEEPAATDVEPAATPRPVVSEETTGAASTSPAPAPASADPAPASADPAPAPAPALVTRTESADNGVHVMLAEDPSQTAVASTIGPSNGVDDVRVQLDVVPDQQGTVLPVFLSIENRGDGPLELPEGLTTTIVVTAEDGTTREVVLRNAEVTQIAAGQRVEVGGSVDFGSYGSFELSATTPVAERG